MAGQKQQPCPFCNGQVLTNSAGRIFSSINNLFQRCFNIRIPTGLLSALKSLTPVSKKDIFKNPSDCVCGGRGTIEDPSNDNEKWQQVVNNAKAHEKEILELEGKLAPACGNRYTIIQGCDLLEVGLGMNNAPSYRVDKDKGVANRKFLDPSKMNTDKDTRPILQGGKANHVQGINSLASPGGHYMIKCANKFSVIAGAQGIDLTTGGPLNISAGIIKITGPELSIGTQTGKLTLEGETLHLNGKSVEVAPSDGHFVVRGTGGFTGNCIVAGHTHSESASVVNLSVPGKTETTNPASSSNLLTGPAFWGSEAMELIMPALQDYMAFILTNVGHPKLASGMLGTRYMESLMDKMMTLIYGMIPIELVMTGICITDAGVGIVYNFPHAHSMPDENHVHDMRVPDIDYTSEDAKQVRAKAGGAGSPAPLQKSVSLIKTIEDTVWSILSVIGAAAGSLLKTPQKL